LDPPDIDADVDDQVAAEREQMNLNIVGGNYL